MALWATTANCNQSHRNHNHNEQEQPARTTRAWDEFKIGKARVWRNRQEGPHEADEDGNAGEGRKDRAVEASDCLCRGSLLQHQDADNTDTDTRQPLSDEKGTTVGTRSQDVSSPAPSGITSSFITVATGKRCGEKQNHDSTLVCQAQQGRRQLESSNLAHWQKKSLVESIILTLNALGRVTHSEAIANREFDNRGLTAGSKRWLVQEIIGIPPPLQL
ncbi:hypothetical protein QBC43DRAFT_316659 [Cladorrhinum sp. PSN259]|nr:hypothetical protein QBC43DRAFT_316659 [Cladorrhinum sp. PSN259]